MIHIENLLKQKGLYFKNSIQEYTDHFTSMYEDYMDSHEEKQAELYVKVAISRLDSKQINKDYFTLYYKNKLIMTSTFSLSLLLTSLFLFPSDPPSINPIDFKANQISCHYGLKMHPIQKKKTLHKGIDIKAKIGEPVRATSGGLIVTSTYNEKNGYFIVIKHDKTYSTKYLHLSKIDVKEGDSVKKGDKIGEVGNTGLSTGPHLHYEVLENGIAIDPAPFLKA